ncbi:SusC/RagA family TonB-linked outer membrane protein [Aridibaculum aurantiacum]|uniref:SusC/RagA family TonB-linked outer membrane protein n=1 Tax=Aridibaculum aurantiacum TaxID=2810307 RepID=UPI001A967F51|nr:TonB-dependent receptor [Aridibaculum aurantiacum]
MKNLLLRRVLMVFSCALLFLNTFAQNRTITGVVRDDKGNPLSGATVAVRDSRILTTTNAEGIFTLSVPANARTLVISYVGMQNREVAIESGTSAYTVALTPGTSNLTDVVVVGYGRANRANLTSAQTSVGAKEIERTVNTTIEQALQGRAAGVYITQNSGQPGGGISVNIRGVSSINGNTEPLYVIDGVQVQGSQVSFGAQSSANPLAGLNPNDIEDMQILQGPSATAIYGSRGTNGVILITTKRGKSGEARLNYQFQYNVQTPPRRLAVMNLPQYAQMVKDFRAIAGGAVRGELMDPSLLGPGTDWQGELFNNAAMSKHQLSLSGGANNTTYYVSGEYLKQEGIAVGSGFDRYGFRVNLETKPREWITLGTNLNFNQTKEQLTTSNENVISNALQLSPEIPVKNLNGSWGGGDITNPAHQYSPVNPIAIATLTTNNNTRRQFLGGLNLGLNLYKGLTFRTSFNTSVNYGNSTLYTPTYAIGWARNVTATLTNGTNQSTYWNFNQLLEYSRQFGKHNASIMVSHEAQESQWKNVMARRTGFLTNDIFDLDAGDATTASNSGGSGPWAMESYLGRLNYNYDNRYIFTGTIRRDGSINFGPENRWGTFPSLSAAWRISQENFFKIPFISEMKLRFETGLTGNQGSGNSAIYSPLSAGATPWGTGFLPSVYPNPKLQWEETRTDNVGVNIGMLNNRINVEFDYYIKNTDNLIMPAGLPWYMGTNGTGSVGAPTVNAGALQTKGWGLTINTTNVSNKNFRWESNLNLSSFKTVIKNLNSERAFFERTSWWLNNWTQRSAVGMEPWLFRGYVVEGVFQSVDEINNSAVPVDNNGNRYPTAASGGIWVGDYKFKDVNGDGKIDVADQTFIGNPWPKLFGGFTNTFSYKGFDLSVLITGTYGNDIYNYMASANSNPNNINLGRNLLTNALDYAKVNTDPSGKVYLANPGTRVARIIAGADVNGNYVRNTSLFVEDGSFIRLKNVSLSYNLPTSLISRQRYVRGVRATLGAQNLATLTRYTGFDPEVGAYVGRDASSANQAIGLDFGRYPLTPIYTFTLGVNF